jgi:hypothetical protein
MSEVLPLPLPKKRRKWLMPVAIAVIVTVIVGAAVVLHSLGLHDLPRSKWRREWKAAVIAAVEKQTSDRGWVEKEVSAVKAKLESQGEADGGWSSSSLILMGNGDWIAYASRCRKEDWRIRDIFIGRASDGKWYYSTYHFCIGMLSLRVDDRPESLAKFISTYSLREFDGRSDECLKQTWPTPEP